MYTVVKSVSWTVYQTLVNELLFKNKTACSPYASIAYPALTI